MLCGPREKDTKTDIGRKILKKQEVFELLFFCGSKRGEVERWGEVSVGHWPTLCNRITVEPSWFIQDATANSMKESIFFSY